jgi:hypothetical protein
MGKNKFKARKPAHVRAAQSPKQPEQRLVYENAIGGPRFVGMDEKVDLRDETTDGKVPTFSTGKSIISNATRRMAMMNDVHPAGPHMSVGRFGDPGMGSDPESINAAIERARRQKASKRTFTTLADLCADPRSFRDSAALLPPTTPRDIRQYRVLTLDDDTVQHAVILSAAYPKEVIDMLQIATPPWDKMWVEMSSKIVLEHRARVAEASGTSLNYNPRRDTDRIGMMFTRHGDFFNVMMFETGSEGGPASEYAVHEWPIGFDIGIGDYTFDRMKQVGDHHRDGNGKLVFKLNNSTNTVAEQTAAIWGYRGKVKGMSRLHSRARATTVPRFAQVLATNKDVVSETVKEISGMTRLAVAILALLNTVSKVEAPTKPSGRRTTSSGTIAYVERAVTYMQIGPRIRDREKYVRSAIRDEATRRRYHEVRGHYRHVKVKPSTPGWTEVQIDGETYWRKHIDAHHRGDIELGVVAHDVTVVTDPQKCN